MSEDAVLDSLNKTDYLRHRIQPDYSDSLYLHLSDLLLSLQTHSTKQPLRVLDFGAGGSPYRFLFPNAIYQRADISGSELDYKIQSNGLTEAPSEIYDLILSTQVLEHCSNYQVYLSECFRLLRKDGKLLLTTHGMYEEHGCPYDFTRWTEDGLKSIVENQGFLVAQVQRLTTGPRAGFFLLDRSIGSIHSLEGGFLSRFFWRVFKRIFFFTVGWRNHWLDRVFDQYRICKNSDLPGSSMYVALLIEAYRK